jgi:hypothetical protein
MLFRIARIPRTIEASLPASGARSKANFRDRSDACQGEETYFFSFRQNAFCRSDPLTQLRDRIACCGCDAQTL